MEAQSHAPPGSTCLLALRALLPPAAGEAEALRISWASEVPALDPHCFKETADDNTGRHLFGARMLARPGSQTGGMACPLGVPVNALVNAGQTRIQPCRARRGFSRRQFRPSPGCRDSRSRRRIRRIELESSQESPFGRAGRASAPESALRCHRGQPSVWPVERDSCAATASRFYFRHLVPDNENMGINLLFCITNSDGHFETRNCATAQSLSYSPGYLRNRCCAYRGFSDHQVQALPGMRTCWIARI